MVHKWLLRKTRGKILAGLIIFFILGPIWFILGYSYFANYNQVGWGLGDCWTISCRGRYTQEELELGRTEIMYTSVAVGFIGIIFLIFGSFYLLKMVILEYIKKRRHAHRSNTYQ